MNLFSGIGVALVTPFNKGGDLDIDSLENLINHCISGEVDYLVSLGTTSEVSTLNEEEQQILNQSIVNFTSKRVPLVIGIGGNSTEAIIEKIKKVDLTGFSAILSVTPYYNKPNQEGLYEHFKKIAINSPLPIILYNVPSRTGCNLSVETIIRLANDFDNIIAIKEASGCISTAMKILKYKPNDFSVISGDDMTALPLVLSGSCGVVSVIANGLPKQFSDMIRMGLEGNNKKAYEIQYKMLEIIDMIFEEGNPAGIKSLLKALGILKTSEVRLPLVEVSESLRERIVNFKNSLQY